MCLPSEMVVSRLATRFASFGLGGKVYHLHAIIFAEIAATFDVGAAAPSPLTFDFCSESPCKGAQLFLQVVSWKPRSCFKVNRHWMLQSLLCRRDKHMSWCTLQSYQTIWYHHDTEGRKPWPLNLYTQATNLSSLKSHFDRGWLWNLKKARFRFSMWYLVYGSLQVISKQYSLKQANLRLELRAELQKFQHSVAHISQIEAMFILVALFMKIMISFCKYKAIDPVYCISVRKILSHKHVCA